MPHRQQRQKHGQIKEEVRLHVKDQAQARTDQGEVNDAITTPGPQDHQQDERKDPDLCVVYPTVAHRRQPVG